MPSSTLPIIVFPYNDPDGKMLPHLIKITPPLKTIFKHAVVSIPEATSRNRLDAVTFINSDSFYHIVPVSGNPQAGEHFRTLYYAAIQSSAPEQIFHLAFLDRLAFILSSGYAQQFAFDMLSMTPLKAPCIYARTPFAWDTHPRNYSEIESWPTRLGELFWQRSLDFCWCHFAATASQLAFALPKTHSKGIEIEAEIVLALMDRMTQVEVDWLAWEDPHILGISPDRLKRERESDPQEHIKRLNYVLPMLELIRAQIGNTTTNAYRTTLTT